MPAADPEHPPPRAFASFTEAAGSLERTYGQLQGQVAHLRQELEVGNRDLASSLDENHRIRGRLRHILEQCSLASCARPRSLWQRLRDRHRPNGTYLQGVFHCRPQCLENALVGQLSRLRRTRRPRGSLRCRKILDCRTQPCVAGPKSIGRRLDIMRQTPHPHDVEFGPMNELAEMAHIASGCTARLTPEQVRLGRIGRFTWLRLDVNRYHRSKTRSLPTNLIFRLATSPANPFPFVRASESRPLHESHSQ
jgi:hypothetical protein